mmetsp:Transcript_21292/g.20434  ORF Transcript_21292/g.20434 Transcript_21292/m.20434 type:complete len:129 (+) Transcript_21292:253-639(+)
MDEKTEDKLLNILSIMQGPKSFKLLVSLSTAIVQVYESSKSCGALQATSMVKSHCSKFRVDCSLSQIMENIQKNMMEIILSFGEVSQMVTDQGIPTSTDEVYYFMETVGKDLGTIIRKTFGYEPNLLE